MNLKRFTSVLVFTAISFLTGINCNAQTASPVQPLAEDSSSISNEAAVNPQKFVADNKGNTEFAVDLFGKLRTGDGNIFFSPYSISTALAMTYGGARGETAAQMGQTLHFKLSPAKLHSAFGALENHFATIEQKGQVQLAVANSLWPQAGFAFLPDYLALCQRDYHTSITSVDYKNHTEAARKTINHWIEKKTNQKIVDLLKPGVLNSSTRLVLANAIYFKGRWLKPFKPDRTEKEAFHVSTEKSVTAPLMRQTGYFNYGESADLQILELPYEGNDLSMLILLPRTVEGLGNLETQLTAPKLAAWTELMGSREVRVVLPKFKVTSEFSLSTTLATLGMPDAFNADLADFSGMDGKRDLFISDVIHKAFVEVKEDGTEAAAATGIAVAMSSAMRPETEPPVFRADHPFLFLIRDNQTGTILFLGRLTDPTN